MIPFRIGHGYDVHRLTEGRKLIIGGVEIPHRLGLDGHSDADVLTHAVMDAMLGALALGDIGQHFPDTDPEYAGADSIALLRHVCALIQKPKLAPYIPQMRARIADTLGCGTDRVSIKATTEERLGFTGQEQGIAAHCVVLLERIAKPANFRPEGRVFPL